MVGVSLGSFGKDDWMANFRMSRNLFDYINMKLWPVLSLGNTLLLSVEKQVAAEPWYHAMGSGYRTVSHLFGISVATVSTKVWVWPLY